MSLRNCLIVVWVYAIYVIGTCLFISGYLMKHLVVFQNSSVNVHLGSAISCRDFASLHVITDEFIKSLESSTEKLKKSRLKRFDKAVLIIIDALRYDFVLNSSAICKDDEFYLNKMPIFTKLLKKFPYNAALFELTADPPTTTLQRLKGITTGSLPTFIDISRNFASTEIKEDNLIRQMKKLNKSVVFMGDDTWSSIFPDQFTHSYPYPSFNVKVISIKEKNLIMKDAID